MPLLASDAAIGANCHLAPTRGLRLVAAKVIDHGISVEVAWNIEVSINSYGRLEISRLLTTEIKA